MDTVIRHGYTLADLHLFTRKAVVADRLLAMPVPQKYDIAFSAIAEAVCAAEHPPLPQALVRVGWSAIYRDIKDTLRSHGVGEDWSSPHLAPRFTAYWNEHRISQFPDTRIVEGMAVAQILPLLTEANRQALMALAALGDYALAADSLGIKLPAFEKRISAARKTCLQWWHEGETPLRRRTHDKRVGVRGKEPSTHCANGHEWTLDTTRNVTHMFKGRVRRWRLCKACEQERYQKRKEADAR